MNYGSTVVRMRFGSHVYGTNLPTSDVDIKAVHVPPGRDVLLQRAKASILQKTNSDNSKRNSAQDTDFESFSIQRFMELLLQGQTGPLSMLFTPDCWVLQTSSLWERIQVDRRYWLHSGIAPFVGYCRQQANKYGIRGGRVAAARDAVAFFEGLIARAGHTAKLREHWSEIDAYAAGAGEFVQLVEHPHSDGRLVKMIEVCNRKVQEHATLKEARNVYQIIFDQYGQRALQAERNENVDWKAMMHAVRVCFEAEELLLHHSITYPSPRADVLLRIRKGEMKYAEVAEILEAGILRLEECQKLTTLPPGPQFARAEELILGAHSEAAGCGSTQQQGGV